MEAIDISLSGLNVEWQRLQVIAQNIANIQTSRTATGEAYRARRLVSGPVADFKQIMTRQTERALNPREVMVYDIAQMNGGSRLVYDPSHPHADPSGNVHYPTISQADEMTLMVKASRAYEANLVALAAAQQMYSNALQIGRSA